MSDIIKQITETISVLNSHAKQEIAPESILFCLGRARKELTSLHAENERLKEELQEYKDSILYLLDTTDGAVRERYKGLRENLIGSLAINYIELRDKAGRSKILNNES